MTWGAVAVGVGSAVLGAYSADRAGKQSADASKDAARMQQQQFQQTRGDLMPWQSAGQMSLQQIMSGLNLGQGGSQGGAAPTREQFTIAGTPGRAAVAADQNYGGTGAWRAGSPATAGTPGSFDQSGYDTALADYNAQGSNAQGSNAQGSPDGMFTHQFGLQDFQESPAYQFNLQQGQQALDKSANARGNLYAPQTLQDLSKFSQGQASNEWSNAYNQYNNNIGNIWNRLYGISSAGQSAANQTGSFGQAAAQNSGNATMAAGNAQASGTMGVNTAIQGGLNNYMFQQYLQDQQRPAYEGGNYNSPR